MSTMSNFFDAAVGASSLEAAINAMTLAVGPIVLALHAMISFMVLHAIVKHVVTNHVVPSFKTFDRMVTAFIMAVYNAHIRPLVWPMCCILFTLLHVVFAVINVRLIVIWHIGTWADCYRRSDVKTLKGIVRSYAAIATFCWEIVSSAGDYLDIDFDAVELQRDNNTLPSESLSKVVLANEAPPLIATVDSTDDESTDGCTEASALAESMEEEPTVETEQETHKTESTPSETVAPPAVVECALMAASQSQEEPALDVTADKNDNFNERLKELMYMMGRLSLDDIVNDTESINIDSVESTPSPLLSPLVSTKQGDESYTTFAAVLTELRERIKPLPVRDNNYSICLESQTTFARVMVELLEQVIQVKLTALRSAALKASFVLVLAELPERVKSLPPRPDRCLSNNHSIWLEINTTFARVMVELLEQVKLTALRSAALKASFALVLHELPERVKSLPPRPDDRCRSAQLEFQSSLALALVELQERVKVIVQRKACFALALIGLQVRAKAIHQKRAALANIMTELLATVELILPVEILVVPPKKKRKARPGKRQRAHIKKLTAAAEAAAAATEAEAATDDVVIILHDNEPSESESLLQQEMDETATIIEPAPLSECEFSNSDTSVAPDERNTTVAAFEEEGAVPMDESLVPLGSPTPLNATIPCLVGEHDDDAGEVVTAAEAFQAELDLPALPEEQVVVEATGQDDVSTMDATDASPSENETKSKKVGQRTRQRRNKALAKAAAAAAAAVENNVENGTDDSSPPSGQPIGQPKQSKNSQGHWRNPYYRRKIKKSSAAASAAAL